jgi:hypothetical protein
MALEGLFVPNLPEIYGATPQLLRNWLDEEGNPREGIASNLRLIHQFQTDQKLPTQIHETSDNSASLKCVQTAKNWLSRVQIALSGIREHRIPQNNASLKSQP